jgi:uncharacterized membrane protein YhaH (DUF805 family)
LPGRTSKRPNVLWALFRFDGRLSRQSYWLALVFVWLIGKIALSPYTDLFVMMLEGGDPEELEGFAVSPLPLIILGVVSFSQLAIIVKRLHDRNLTGWFALALAVPIIPVHLVLLIVLGVIPGTPGANRYGPAPDSRPA